MTRKPPGAPAPGEPGETAGGGAPAPGEPAGATAETTAEASAANASPSGARSAAQVEDHAPDPPDPLNDSQLPHLDRSPAPALAGRARPAAAACTCRAASRASPAPLPASSPPSSRSESASRGRGDHLRRLLARAGGVPRRAGRHRVHSGAPAGVVGRALDQRGRARRPDPHPGDRREIPPAPAGDRGRVRPQRPKVQAYDETESYQARLFIVARDRDPGRQHPRRAGQHLRRPQDGSDFPGGRVGRLRPGAPADPDGGLAAAPERRELPRLRLDAIVDSCFPILESFGDRLEDLEDEVLSRPSQHTIQAVHRMKRELLLVRRAMWPMREVLGRLQRDPHECFSDVTRTYVRDVIDHVVQLIDLIETYREVANGLTETYMTAISNRMNEIMRCDDHRQHDLHPRRLLRPVYGMNFRHLPELEWCELPRVLARCASCSPSRWSRGSAAAAGCRG